MGSIPLILILICGYSMSASIYPRQRISNTQPTQNIIAEPAFKNAGSTPGLQIWRIMNFKPVPVSPADFGKFYTGDSYIVLSTIGNRGNLDWNIHFWLGKETTQDESGSAAILTVALDDQLGKKPVQHREVQSYESQLFRSYFKSGLQYLSGGANSGFRHVTPNAANQKRLYQVKGKRNVRVKEVDVSMASLNMGDCFVLDAGNNIYVFHGPKSRRVEQLKAVSFANLVRDQDHGGRSRIAIVDQSSTDAELSQFFSIFGKGSLHEIPDESIGGDDEQFLIAEEQSVTLDRVSDSSGKMVIGPANSVSLEQSLLNTNDCFILNTKDGNVYIWIGKKCNAAEKTATTNKANTYLQSKKALQWASVVRVIEGGEPAIFREYFPRWQGVRDLHQRLIRSAEDLNQIESTELSGLIANFDNEEDNATEYTANWPHDLTVMDDPVLLHAHRDDNGKMNLREIENFAHQDLRDNDILILDNGNAMYVWVGEDSSKDEQEAAIHEVHKRYKAELGKNTAIVTVKQGEEPDIFKSLFPNWNEEEENIVN